MENYKSNSMVFGRGSQTKTKQMTCDNELIQKTIK